MLPTYIILALFITYSETSRILVVSPTPSYSHQVIFQPIWRELALRGHDVVALTTDPIREPSITNLKEIDLGFSYQVRERNLMKIVNNANYSIFKLFSMLKLQYDLMEQQLKHSEVQAIIKNKTEHFDLVMIEYHLAPLLAFKERFNCPLIGLASIDIGGPYHENLGNPNHAVQYPEYILGFPKELNFYQRLISVLGMKMLWFYWSSIYLPDENAIVEKYFGPGYPDTHEISKSVDMIFINSNPVFYQVRPITPATIMISGGIHMKEKKPLPKDLDVFFNNSKHGVIYMSLGGNVKSKDLTNETREMFIQVFSELQYDVLWKFEADDLPGKPSNVKIIKWAPQQDILRHPKLKLFITQCGMQSLEEAVLSHAPMLAVPFYGDQNHNSKQVLSKGLGLMIKYKTMTKKELKSKILEVIDNPKYKERTIELAGLLKDEPMGALEKATWWTEYVLRHGGAQHLKGRTIPTYQFLYLDIAAFVCVISIAFVFIVYKVFKTCFSMCCRSKFKFD